MDDHLLVQEGSNSKPGLPTVNNDDVHNPAAFPPVLPPPVPAIFNRHPSQVSVGPLTAATAGPTGVGGGVSGDSRSFSTCPAASAENNVPVTAASNTAHPNMNHVAPNQPESADCQVGKHLHTFQNPPTQSSILGIQNDNVTCGGGGQKQGKSHTLQHVNCKLF